MAPFRYDPYLWIHLAGVATVPLWLAICGLGLAVGSPQWPELELSMILALGVLPVVGMQLRRPFCIFSLLLLTLKPEALTEDQRRLLTLFRQGWIRLVAVVAPLPLVWVLLQLYPVALVAADMTPFGAWGRWGGLAMAAVSFLMANLFWQVPVSVLLVMATSEQRFQATLPYAVALIPTSFTQVGLPLPRLLPTVLPPVAARAAAVPVDLPDLSPLEPSEQPPDRDLQADSVTPPEPRDEPEPSFHHDLGDMATYHPVPGPPPEVIEAVKIELVNPEEEQQGREIEVASVGIAEFPLGRADNPE
ncbi:MAG TPA: low-complexity tail membrane protein [Leptolyngbyaceae cyanobacterium M65_K2018_010]|nr:low-complexity tail membrane protein [Leptolyngbyaceae cyanobacterium M65_K2018_010]